MIVDVASSNVPPAAPPRDSIRAYRHSSEFALRRAYCQAYVTLAEEHLLSLGDHMELSAMTPVQWDIGIASFSTYLYTPG